MGGNGRGMSARSYIEQFKAILEGGVPVLKVFGDKKKKRPRVLMLVGSGSQRSLVLARPRTAREHAMFASWHESAWWEKLAARGDAKGTMAVASYVARQVIAGKSYVRRSTKHLMGGKRQLLLTGPEKRGWSLSLADLKEVVEEKKKTLRLVCATGAPLLEALSSHVHSYLLAGLTLIVLEAQKTTPKAGSWTVPDVPKELLNSADWEGKGEVTPLKNHDLDRFTRILAAGVRLRKHSRNFSFSAPRRRVFFCDLQVTKLGWRRIDGMADPRKCMPFAGLQHVAGPGLAMGRPASFALTFLGGTELCLEASTVPDAQFYVAGFLALMHKWNRIEDVDDDDDSKYEAPSYVSPSAFLDDAYKDAPQV